MNKEQIALDRMQNHVGFYALFEDFLCIFQGFDDLYVVCLIQTKLEAPSFNCCQAISCVNEN